MMSSVARVKYIKTEVILRYLRHFKIPKAFQTKFHQIRITKSNSSAEIGKTIRWEKIFVLQNRPISALQIGGSFTIDKSDQEALQVGSYRHFKWRQNDYKSGQQDYKLGQRLQIREE